MSKVRIRKIEKIDLQQLWTLIYGTKNPEWKKWDAPYFPLQYLTFEQYYEQEIEKINGIIEQNKMVIEAEGEIIGLVNYYWEHKPSRWLECGIAIHNPSYWNGGYGTDALKQWVTYLFETLPLVRVGLTTWSGNMRMMKVAEKLGFTLEGRLRKCRYHKGEYYDSIRMGVLREEWERQNNCGL